MVIFYLDLTWGLERLLKQLLHFLKSRFEKSKMSSNSDIDDIIRQTAERMRRQVQLNSREKERIKETIFIIEYFYEASGIHIE